MASVGRDGYVRAWVNTTRPDYEHRLAWERVRGPIAPGLELHHINGDRRDNRIDNLLLVSSSEHRRIHNGWAKDADGRWLKPCRKCGRMLPLEQFFPNGRSFTSFCRPCDNTATRERMRNYRAALAREERSK
jgi:hypothetical protein